MNNRFVQICGPFSANVEVMDSVEKSVGSTIQHLGIQSQIKNFVKINGQLFEIGSTCFLEFSEVNITSIIFLQNEPASTIIDMLIK